MDEKINALEAKQSEENFWSDQKNAQKVIKEYNTLRDLKNRYYQNEKGIESLLEELDELNRNYDAELFELLNEEYEEVNSSFEDFEIKVLLSNDYDHSNAILEIHPGAGGTESQDWAEMLFRMYQRYAQNNGYGFEVISYEEADEAGIKSCIVAIKGDMAYGYLKGESGVHRLVRISPFDASSRRHTSFASVEVLPEFNNEIDIEIRDEDLE
ncbi:MAG: PCRF domain-containing protein, partial [Erysipelotrichaceae bacterium]|nr:PCRF domain-containing protein [Erysipelotrichaceae bacterium]